MTRKYDYKMPVVRMEEAMDILGYTTQEKFIDVAVKYAPDHVEISPNERMFSLSEVKAIATGINKDINIPDEIKERCLETEIDKPKKPEEPVEPVKRLEHPFMEGTKCLEQCFHRDEYGFCKCGDHCIIYDVAIAPQKGVVARVNDELEVSRANTYEKKRQLAERVYENGSAHIAQVQDILMKQLYAMTAPNLTQDERDTAIKTGLAVSNVSKTVLSSFGLQMQAFNLANMYGIDKNGVKKLI